MGCVEDPGETSCGHERAPVIVPVSRFFITRRPVVRGLGENALLRPVGILTLFIVFDPSGLPARCAA
jgi:hypothetical protein